MGWPTLETYLRNSVEHARIIDFRLRAAIAPDGRVIFYVHPDGLDGETADFEVVGNQLEHNRDIE